MVNWEDPGIVEWRKRAMDLQQMYCDSLSDCEWHKIERGEETILLRKVGYGLFGSPKQLPTIINLFTGYDDGQLKKIRAIIRQLGVNINNKAVLFGCIFVEIKTRSGEFSVPVFKAKYEGDFFGVFVDEALRKYATWESYLADNVLPKCLCCYPTDGKYQFVLGSETVYVDFDTSPACNAIKKTATFFDGVATVATVASAAVGVAALCAIPIAGPLLAASTVAGTASAIYGAGRTGSALYDRATHGQTIDPTESSEARLCWLSLVGSGLGMTQGAMLRSMTEMARAGDVMSMAGRIAYMAVQAGSLTVNGIGIINGLAVLIEKHEENTLTALDVFQFSASVLFFTNSVMNTKTASTIIKDVQQEVISSHRSELSPDAKKFMKYHTWKLRGKNDLIGNAKVVKALNNIGNTQDFFELMVDKNISYKQVRLTPDGVKGFVKVNNNLKIHPLALQEIKPELRQEIFQSTKAFASKQITKQEFHSQMKPICSEYRMSFETMRKDTLARVKTLMKDSGIVLDYFANAKPCDIDRLGVALCNTANSDESVIAIAAAFAEKMNCNSVEDFVSYVEYVANEISQNVAAMDKKFTDSRGKAQENSNFNVDTFKKEWGIPDGIKRKTFMRDKVISGYQSETGINGLMEKFNSVKANVSELNNKSKFRFSNDNLATYHYLKHKRFGIRDLTEKVYFAIAEDLIGKPTNQTNSLISQDGSVTMVNYRDPSTGAFAVVFNNNFEEGSSIATIMYKPTAKK